MKEFGHFEQTPAPLYREDEPQTSEIGLPGFAIVQRDMGPFGEQVIMPFPTDGIRVLTQVGARPWCIVRPSPNIPLSPQEILTRVPDDYLFHEITLDCSLADDELYLVIRMIKADEELKRILPYDKYSLLPSQEGLTIVMNKGHLTKNLAVRVVSIIENIVSTQRKK